MSEEYDVIIVGGGIVGTSLALTLARSSFDVALIEATSEPARPISIKTDKTIVLSHSSRVIFESLGIWENLAQDACPINEIHVSDRGHFGSSRMTAEEEKIGALGYVLSAGKINNVLHSALKAQKNICLFQPAEFEHYQYHSNKVEVSIIKEKVRHSLEGKLLVACDGQASAVRKYLNIEVSIHDYEQVALVCNVELKRSHNNIAYERFTDQGPLAMLPQKDQWSAAVWTVTHSEGKRLLALPSARFLNELQHSFGYRMGKMLSCTQPVALNLKLTTAMQQIGPGMALLGNAVHTLHPVAGQGLNLGMRDLAVLAEELYVAKKNKQPIGSMATLQQYLNRRKKDQEQVIKFTHSLIGLFSNSFLPVVVARNGGMMLLDRVNGLKKILTKRALGLSGKVPRLACGMTLE